MAKYRNQTETVEARQVKAEESVELADGEERLALVGEWIITHQDGRQSVCDADTFKILYSPVSIKQPKKRGRPTTYNKRIGEKLCRLLEDGHSLRSICARDDMPATSTFYQWYKSNAEFAERYADARALQAILMDDDLQAVADDSSRDYKTVVRNDEEVEVPDHEHIARSKLRVDTMKFRMMKMAPRLFGEKVKHEVTGEDGGEIVIRLARPDELSEEEQKAAGCGS